MCFKRSNVITPLPLEYHFLNEIVGSGLCGRKLLALDRLDSGQRALNLYGEGTSVLTYIKDGLSPRDSLCPLEKEALK